MQVYEYADQVKTSGLVFMDTPGYDPVSATGQVAGGANLICFTTGRGSAFGAKRHLQSSSPPTPRLTFASWRTLIYQLRRNPRRDVSLPDTGEKIFRKIVAIASGGENQKRRTGVW